MRVAFASTDGKNVDQHFGHAEAFHLWDVDADGVAYVGRLAVAGGSSGSRAPADTAGAETEDRIVAKATLLRECAIACSLQIGGPAAAKLVARHVHPLKTGSVVPIDDLLARFQDVLRRGAPPPWLAKANGLPVRRTLSPEEEA